MKHFVITAGAVLILTSAAALVSPGAEAVGASQTATARPAAGHEQLDQLLAPVALYPDQLLSQILMCATNPGKLATLNEWLASQQGAKGADLQEAATKAGFGPSYVALVVFPDVVSTMAAKIDWTRRVGEAFTASQSAVFQSVQRLRKQAQAVGTLKSTSQQEVESRTTSSGEQVIVIEPANPQVVYVPQYNPQVVYTQAPSTTVVVQEDDDSDAAVAAGLIGFTAGIAIGAAIDNDYYYGPYGYRGGFYMYNDAWDDWYDHREDAREDWMEHREDVMENRGEYAGERQENRTEARSQTQSQRTERQQTRQETRPDTQAQREQRRTEAQAAAPQASATARSTAESRGYTRDTSQRAAPERSGTRSDAFSGYSSGRSERAASQRGQRSRSSARSGGGRRR